MLHQNEWHIATALWTGIGAGTIAAIAYSDKLFPLPFAGPLPVAMFYIVVAASYLLGFCRANYKSLTEERSRYRYFQNEALKLAGAPQAALILEKSQEPQPHEHHSNEVGQSNTWRFKVWSTYLVQTTSLFVLSSLHLRMGGALDGIIYAGALWLVAGLSAFLIMLYGANLNFKPIAT